MTDIAHATSPPAHRGAAPRHDAFHAAGRHTRRVRWLRRMIIVGAVSGSALVVLFAFFNPFRSGISGVSVSGIGFNGTRITMDHPFLSGFRGDGRPYDLRASYAVQDAKSPNILELHEIDAHVTMADKSVIHIVAAIGTYDSSKETMQLKTDIRATSDNGLDTWMSSASIEFKSGILDSRDPVRLVMNTGTVSADSVHVSDNGNTLTFEGRVRTMMTPPAAAEAAAAYLKGTTR